ncbi:molybdate ABC transporter substrate-binding protein [Rhodobacter capsulatus]|uniref:molybdate ABC transporter substrate-binding protein n=1 Tax=Rhodobacter capsulatus TaxID=1061 RepID=UPI0006DC8380|nr:molybdate ABC transporter substrate-binding protein [Rhodobacter capsulatus]KQB12193.1 molybdenum ABC transporter substrate-binding protein [Rhodobacter capsulatus]KQB12665.1 molybdenum ABC transporter substrate-binding protein [Rhodobacter capsulatus]PZX23249.1 molybdate transport system substrate-binding protein [Rhodobacter capsulatus]QNR61737.1 molybdate ABC transporter substrate-binding protein [Rhodobacter capsulatus]
MRKSLAILSVLVLSASASLAEDLVIGAGAGYRRPMAEAVAAWKAQSGDSVGEVYGNMGQVLGQARESGKMAMVCGDKAVLAKAEGLRFERFLPLGTGKLVVAFRKGVSLADPAELAGERIVKVGIPDEKSAIYGKAGRQYLDRSGLAAKVDPKLVAVATVPQVTAYLISGDVDAGFLNITDAIGAGADLGGWVAVDPGLYPPIEISCGVLDASAEGFAAFLTTPAAQKILQHYGL